MSSDIPTPPSAPNPASDAGVLPEFRPVSLDNIPSPPPDFDWDIMSMEADTAMRLVFTAVHDLALANGDVPPTPAITRPETPSKYTAVIQAAHARHRHHRRTPSRPATPIPEERSYVDPDPIEPPEASSDEPITTNTGQIGTESEPSTEEIANLARKFYSKHVPNVSLEKYSLRMQTYCPMTTPVWLGAGAYIYRMCCVDKRVPLTERTMHRVLLASLVTAMKALEDHRWHHGRFAKVGGVEAKSLTRVELAVIYLTGGHLQFLNPDDLRDAVVGLQKAARDATQANQLAATFNLALPTPKNSLE
ncbi:cyclin-domain-containing protein [Clohesyomyces aquaticus]|uniref:Cyclin-domain-containing protein n=1 Tax=Clohesyomyces aquaticus TaxID=1231657 RepID=A0A1Y1YJA9_9PLEO|nr:cyclin-domain-containing protein [Clohesyomyces aquaticus]